MIQGAVRFDLVYQRHGDRLAILVLVVDQA